MFRQSGRSRRGIGKCLPKDFDTFLAEGSADEVDDVTLVDFEFSDVDLDVTEGGVIRC